MAIIQSQTQKLTQKLTHQQIQLINILGLPTIALEQCIAQEMAINPALEFDTEMEKENGEEETDLSEPDKEADEDFVSEGKLGEDYDYQDYMDRDSLDDYKYEANNHVKEDEKREQVFLENHHFTVPLITQLHLLPISDKEKEIGTYLINTLDSDGYLRRELTDIADEYSFVHQFVTEDELEKVMNSIKTLDPIGIGARDLRECLLLQLKHKREKTKDTYNAIKILEEHMEELSAKNFEAIKKAMKIDCEEFQDALSEIRKLNPAPAGSTAETGGKAITIEPDFTVAVDGDKVELFLNSPKHAPLKVSEDYTEMLNSYSKSKDKASREASSFIKSKVESAKWFIEALQQREKVMITVARAIVKHQNKFFLTGDEADLKPLILKTIAEEIDSDISTVSRIVISKYIQTSYGVILMKNLFTEGLKTTNGEIVSTKEVKKVLLECVNAEDKNNPLSDEQIAHILMERTYSIARRTVAKYREELKIPSKNYRKAMAA
ncbi:MAG: polymerase, sigma 54 subunit, RpoN/SigL [Bacteroidetes bacterium]|jgi:RNA polymerase sigma-54 factor|nr:polymerase, sigma 54 subunit, RpoN/SigL [Bacteroidota bacterium]